MWFSKSEGNFQRIKGHPNPLFGLRSCSNVTTLSNEKAPKVPGGGCKMTVTTVTSREFNQHPSEAKKAAQNGVVFITDRGQPAHVLLSIDTYRRLTGEQISLLEALAQPAIPLTTPNSIRYASETCTMRRICLDVPFGHQCRFRIAAP